MGQSSGRALLSNAYCFLHVSSSRYLIHLQLKRLNLDLSCQYSPISLRDPGQWDMRNLSTGMITYLSHLPQARPTVRQIHKHIHKCKTSLNFSKRSYLSVWAFHVLQLLGRYPFLVYPLWAETGIFARWPFAALKEAIVGRILTSSECRSPTLRRAFADILFLLRSASYLDQYSRPACVSTTRWIEHPPLDSFASPRCQRHGSYRRHYLRWYSFHNHCCG